MTAEVKSTNMSGLGIAPAITNHPHVAMRGVEKNMTQNTANEVETEVGGAVVMTRTDVKRAKSALVTIHLKHNIPLTNALKAEEGQIRGTQGSEGGEEEIKGRRGDATSR